MKPKKHFLSADVLIVVLALLWITTAVLLAVAKPQYLLYLAVALVVVLTLAFFTVARIRRLMRRILTGKRTEEAAESSGLATLAVPVLALNGDTAVWYNNAFRTEFTGGQEVCLLPTGKLVPGLDFGRSALPGGQNIELGGKLYTAYGNTMRGEKDLFFVIFVENTALKTQAAEYQASRPAVLHIVIDTYDEILREMKESERAQIMTSVDVALEKYIANAGGFLRRVADARYLAVVEERHLQQMIQKRFEILDEVRRHDEESAVATLSIGVGHLAEGLRAAEEMALQALDMALGRGGDQVAVKGPDGFEFYGGVSRSVEKRTKVKSRIIAAAIKDLMGQCDRVLVMGHKNSDFDALGAATGMLRFAQICKKPTAIVINTERTNAESMVEMLSAAGMGQALLSPEEAAPLAGERTMVVVVDTHMPYLLESEEIWRACGYVVVVDHHRRMPGYIDNAVIFYHEPYASSTSELVSELLQYVGDSREERPTPVEAEALLAGIMLDTRTFSLHVGVRTFEASAYLRRMGAQTENVKKLFSSSMDDYVYRSHLVSEAKLYLGCAIVVSERVPFEHEVVAPQAANDLLTIQGVDASFVAIRQGDEVRISARSMGQVNVQLVMEKLGGGGHLTMAGAQLKGINTETTEQLLLDAIANYRNEHANAALQE